jgi:predicted  nucleic acid-binding Zn-ribbon protein
LEGVLSHAKQKLEDHYSGKKLLSEQAVKQFEKKIGIYEHQIKELSRELEPEVSVFVCARGIG